MKQNLTHFAPIGYNPMMPTYLVSATAIVHTRVEADSPDEAADRWLRWRAGCGNEVRLPGGPRMLLTFDTDPTILNEAGRRVLTIDRAMRRSERITTPADTTLGGGP